MTYFGRIISGSNNCVKKRITYYYMRAGDVRV